jgi:enterochelin esterase-like enzyme
MRTVRRQLALVFALLVLSVPTLATDATKSQLVEREIHSKSLENSKIGVSPVRKLVVDLPAGYDAETMRYPVIYFLPSPFDSSFRAIFDQKGAQAVLNRAIVAGTIGRFIFVAVDMTTPLGCSWYVNSPATGNWEDFMVQELVPYIDANFRTLPTRDSRGIAGDFMGGYGAIRFGMKYPQLFGTVYAMHPVGTGNGVKVLAGLPDLDLMERAKTVEDVKQDGYSRIFTTIFQAHVPDPDHPPLFIDFRHIAWTEPSSSTQRSWTACATTSFWNP